MGDTSFLVRWWGSFFYPCVYKKNGHRDLYSEVCIAFYKAVTQLPFLNSFLYSIIRRAFYYSLFPLYYNNYLKNLWWLFISKYQRMALKCNNHCCSMWSKIENSLPVIYKVQCVWSQKLNLIHGPPQSALISNYNPRVIGRIGGQQACFRTVRIKTVKKHRTTIDAGFQRNTCLNWFLCFAVSWFYCHIKSPLARGLFVNAACVRIVIRDEFPHG